MLRPLLLASLSSALLSGAPARRARVAGGVAPRATPCLECDPWQELATPAKYAELVRWYEAHARQSEIPEDLGRRATGSSDGHQANVDGQRASDSSYFAWAQILFEGVLPSPWGQGIVCYSS